MLHTRKHHPRHHSNDNSACDEELHFRQRKPPRRRNSNGLHWCTSCPHTNGITANPRRFPCQALAVKRAVEKVRRASPGLAGYARRRPMASAMSAVRHAHGRGSKIAYTLEQSSRTSQVPAKPAGTTKASPGPNALRSPAWLSITTRPAVITHNSFSV